jgi:hypothetical protein
LSDRNVDLKNAVAIFDKYDTKAVIKELADIDIQFLVLVLETFSEGLESNKEQLDDL